MPATTYQASGPATGADKGRLDPATGEHFFSGGNFNEQQTFLKPYLDLITSGKYRDIPGNIGNDLMGGKISLEEAVRQVQGTKPYNPSTLPQYDFGGGIVKSQRDLREANLLGGGYELPPEVAKRDALTKEQLQAALDHGSDPTNSYTPETSSGSKIKSSLAGSPPGSPVYSTKSTVDTSSLPYPNLGGRPSPSSPTLQSDLQSQYGIPALQTQIDGIDKQIADIAAKRSAELQDIMTTPGVSTRYMSRESAMASKGVSAELAALRAQRIELTRQVTAQTKAISLIMSATNKSYAEAEKEWNFEYQQNQKYINDLDKTSTADVKTAKTIVQSILNSLQPGQDIPDDARNVLDEYVMKAYGPEFLGIEEAGLKGVLYSHTITGADGKKHAMNLIGNPDGSLDLQYITPSARTGGLTPTQQRAKQKTQMLNTTDSYFQSIVDPKTGSINYADYANYKNFFMSHGGDGTAFDAKFRHFLSKEDMKKI